MSMSDPIADMLTRIRNARRWWGMPRWRCRLRQLKTSIAQVLKREGYRGISRCATAVRKERASGL
jgi:ribosomal protein S8